MMTEGEVDIPVKYIALGAAIIVVIVLVIFSGIVPSPFAIVDVPAVIEPMMSISPPLKDAYVRENFPTTNYGADSSLYVRSNTGDNARSLFEFDLSSIPPNRTITGAKLYLYVTGEGWSAQSYFPRNYDLYRVTSPWTESGVTWNNQPSYAGTYESRTIVPPGCSGWVGVTYNAVWVSFDCTDLVRGWYSGAYPNYGMMLRDSVEGDTIVFKRFHSGEYGNHPYLLITFATGSMSVASDPAGAEVYINDNYITTTPDTITSVPAGTYTIKMVKDGYQDWTDSVTVPQDGTVLVSATLVPEITPPPPRYPSLWDIITQIWTWITNLFKW